MIDISESLWTAMEAAVEKSQIKPRLVKKFHGQEFASGLSYIVGGKDSIVVGDKNGRIVVDKDLYSKVPREVVRGLPFTTCGIFFYRDSSPILVTASGLSGFSVSLYDPYLEESFFQTSAAVNCIY